MFEMFKKKNVPEFKPDFGTAEEFAIRRDKKEDNILVINDDMESIDKKCIIPHLMRGNLSYIVYDPNGTYHKATSQAMKEKGYDVQVLDLEDEEHKSRVDVFEIANVARNPYWLAVMLSGSIKCSPDEISTAYHMFMAMMQYLLETQQKITIEDMKELFEKIVEEDWQTKRDMERSPSSRQDIAQMNKAKDKIKKSVFEKTKEHFFDQYYDKLVNPNIFTLTAHNKKTILFIKRVPKQYKGIMTIMMFNLRASGIFIGDGNISALIIDAYNGEWFNKKMLSKTWDEAGLKTGHGVAALRIKGELNTKKDLNKKSIIIYMHSDDAKTKNYVLDALRVKNQMNEEEQKEISVAHFRGKALKDNVLNATPITMEELENIQDCIVIDPTGKARPFRCDEWIVE